MRETGEMRVVPGSRASGIRGHGILSGWSGATQHLALVRSTTIENRWVFLAACIMLFRVVNLTFTRYLAAR